MTYIDYDEWTRFYSEFADILKGYENRQDDFIAGIKRAFAAQKVRLPTLDSNGDPTEMDPFTVFGLFNKDIGLEKRRRIISGLKEEFDVEAPAPRSFRWHSPSG